MNITGIILAGGKSSRMGTDKGLVQLNGRPMISYILSSMEKAGIKDIIIISNNLEYKKFGMPVYPDIIQDKGPLGGIYTGLSKSKTAKNLILSCDIPFIDEKVLNLLIRYGSSEQITVIKYRQRIHNLIGLFDSSLLRDLGEHLVLNKLKVEQFNQNNKVQVLELEKYLPEMNERVFMNVNSLDELKIINDDL